LSTSPAFAAGGFAASQGDGHQHVVRVDIELSDQGVIAVGLLPKLAQLEVSAPEAGSEQLKTR